MNPLEKYPSVRAALYLVQWVANGVLTIAGVVFVSLGTPIDALPQWYVLALAVAPALWTYLGVTAAQNVPSYRDVVEGDAPPPDLERGAADVVMAAVVVLLVLILLAVVGVLRV